MLIVYFIQLSNADLDIDERVTSENSMSEDARAEIDLLVEMKKTCPYLVGYGIGFPSKNGASSESTTYTVNKTCNYYAKQHEEDYQTYGEI